MTINTPNGTIYGGWRVIRTPDTRSGCPGSTLLGGQYATNNVLILQTFTVANPATIWTNARMIYNSDGRCDIQLHVDNTFRKNGLNHVTPSTWEEENVSWTGTVSAGTHYVELRYRTCSDRWGCGADWGEINTLIWEAQ